MPLNWKNPPITTKLPDLILQLRKAMPLLDRILGYTEPLGTTVDWNPGATLAAGAAVGVDVSVPDASLGDLVAVAFSVPFTDDKVRAYGSVKSSGVVRAVIFNSGAGSQALGAGVLAVNVWRA
jgi:hypothetical protein